jgi:two-component system chemotaxis response regulator CheY
MTDTTTPVTAPGATEFRLTALIVDDVAVMRKMLRDILESQKFQVLAEASNGQEAIDLARQHQPNLVTLDITMPVVDGLTALKEIKKINRQIQVVMVSAFGERQNVLEAIKNGAANFIVKPFNAEKVIRVVNSIRF